MIVQVVIHVQRNSETYLEKRIAKWEVFRLRKDDGAYLSGLITKVRECTNPLCAPYEGANIFNLLIDTSAQHVH